MEVFSTMTLVESGGLLMHVSLELLGKLIIIWQRFVSPISKFRCERFGWYATEIFVPSRPQSDISPMLPDVNIILADMKYGLC